MSDVIITDEKVYRDMCQRIMHHYHASGQSFVDGALDCVMTALKPINSNAPQWISVSERLPNPETECLIHPNFESEYFYFTAYYGFQNDGHLSWEIEYDSHGATDKHYPKVTHWMPLPNPPTEST